MGYLKRLDEPTCADCSTPATVVLYNKYNKELGRYCTPCGKRADTALSAHERMGYEHL